MISNNLLLSVVVLVGFLVPGSLWARQSFAQVAPTWNERTGTADFHRSLDHLFNPLDADQIQSLTAQGGPVLPFWVADSPHLQVDGQATVQGCFRNDPLQLPAPLFPFRPQRLAQPNFRWALNTGFQLALPAGFSLWQRTIVGSNRSLDPTARTRDFDQMDANIEVPLATVNYVAGNIQVWLGRNWERWGPGWTGSSILDTRFPTADGFGVTYRGQNLALRYRAGRIDDLLSGGINFQRTIVGHRIDFSPCTNLRIGLSETALIATPGAMPFWALNPLLPWVMAEQEARGSMEKTNIVWAIDSVWNPGAWAFYGQFLLDDYMIDSEDRDTYPDQLGLTLGLAHTRTGSNQQTTCRLGVEYTRLWSWTYVHRDPELIYQAWEQGMGHPAGSDSETITTFWSRTAAAPWQSLTFWARYHRQGQIWLGTAMDPVGSPGLPYPVPPVSTWWQAGLDFRYEWPHSISTRCQLGWSDLHIGPTTDSLSPPPEHSQAVGQWYGSLTVTLNFDLFRAHP